MKNYKDLIGMFGEDNAIINEEVFKDSFEYDLHYDPFLKQFDSYKGWIDYLIENGFIEENK